MKKPLHWAHVLYDEESLISYALANLTFLPYFIVFGHACVLLFRRDLTSLFFWVGYWANEIINSALKFTFRQERPLSEQGNSHYLVLSFDRTQQFFVTFENTNYKN